MSRKKRNVRMMTMIAAVFAVSGFCAAAAMAAGESHVTERRVIWNESGEVPRIECSTMRHCLVELPEGEQVVFAMASDAVRWSFEESSYADRPVIFAKPRDCEKMSTALTIGTTKRRYETVLATSGCGEDETGVGPSERLRFELPKLLVKRSVPPGIGADLRAKSQAESQTEPQAEPVVREVRVEVIEQRNHRYKWRAKRGAPAPIEVWDDGERTYVRLAGEAPAVLDASGAALDVHRDGDLLVLGGLHEKLKLKLSGKRFGPRIVIQRIR